MTLDELEELAKKSAQETPKPFDPKLTLVVPGSWGKSNKKSLVKGGPVGDIVQESRDGLTVIFSATEILEWIAGIKADVEKASKDLEGEANEPTAT